MRYDQIERQRKRRRKLNRKICYKKVLKRAALLEVARWREKNPKMAGAIDHLLKRKNARQNACLQRNKLCLI